VPGKCSRGLALLRCPECRHLLVGHQLLEKRAETDFDEHEWKGASRVWPDPVSELADSIPEGIRACLLEAGKCRHAAAYTASVAMTGRAVEAMCRHFSTPKATFFEGLKELHDRGVIDARLYQWGEELRKHRNLAAHAGGVQFSLLNARDLYEFATAICDYVFVLTENSKTSRKGKREKRQKLRGNQHDHFSGFYNCPAGPRDALWKSAGVVPAE
jgi:hypothetical protein